MSAVAPTGQEHAERIILLGRHYEERGAIAVEGACDGLLAAAISVGMTDKPNEDAVAVVAEGDRITLALADGHWGRDASELAVEVAAECASSDDDELFSAPFLRVDQEMYQLALATGEPFTPETTLIVCRLQRDGDRWRYSWASFGDSCLFVMHNGQLTMLNTMLQCWLGAITHLAELSPPERDNERQIGLTRGLERGVGTLMAGDRLLMASDGLIEPVGKERPIPAADLAATITRAGPNSDVCHALVQETLTLGGRDNVAALLFQP